MTTSPSTAPEPNFTELGENATTECDVRNPPSSPEREAHIGWNESGILETGSDSLKSSSSSVFSYDDSHRPVTNEDCAALLLACLYCRFNEFTNLLLDTFGRAVSHYFPSGNHVTESSERDHQGWECWTCNLGLDWDICNSCQDSAELLELAMEISEVCYR
ncbi:myoD family inhibitor domain-containing protein 2 [Syngnathus scovelli]|uniref:myoD family inhibitor domain-containing protein 2 n=1 Tax=Syngnathus scovelli TaxID=161590 RepID=UPI00210FF9CE|nr:myoD family inhibitor domain-containing protein 2 [Syngnathus scovelli]